MAFDEFGRNIDYLRVSVTDRCNLRCLYCMPEEGVPPKPHGSILSLEEIAAVIEIAAREGIKHIRLTGGEPLVRLGIADLIRQIRSIAGIESIALTTNGILLPEYALSLKQAGLDRVNISLDSLDPEQYRLITRWGDINLALRGIDAALETGFDPVKINVVVLRSLSQDFLAFARMSLDRPLHIRFIEYMPVGDACASEGRGWTQAEMIASDELLAMINEQADAAGLGGLEPVLPSADAANGDMLGAGAGAGTGTGGGAPVSWGPARYYRLPGAIGTVGFIAAVSRGFCTECNRLRLTVDGELLPCLFSDSNYDVKAALRAGDSEAVRQVLLQALAHKPGAHFHRIGTEHFMSQIGG